MKTLGLILFGFACFVAFYAVLGYDIISAFWNTAIRGRSAAEQMGDDV